jgi:hypothetical protein
MLLRRTCLCLQEFCDQGTLANLAATKWLPEQEGDEQMLRRLVLLRDAACGLQALHAACVVHGDLVRCCSVYALELLCAVGGVHVGVVRGAAGGYRRCIRMCHQHAGFVQDLLVLLLVLVL